MNFLWGNCGCKSAEDAFSVRLEVFVNEQGFSPEIEIDDTDDVAFHLTGYDENENPICAARLFNEHDNIWHAGRIAVLKSSRGKGAGRLIMDHIRIKAKELKARELVLGAQYDKAEFYEKCGYKKTGKQFLDEGYPHVEMKLEL